LTVLAIPAAPPATADQGRKGFGALSEALDVFTSNADGQPDSSTARNHNR